jgi:predicted nucleic acid-binding protein
LNYLLDTCFVSELVKPAPNKGAVDWLANQAEERLYLSVITLGELQAGVSKLADSPRKALLLRWLNDDLTQRFTGRLLPVGIEAALVWGIKRGEAAAGGNTLPLADSLIAATAIAHGMTVVTRNTGDLQRCGAMTLNPWS